MSENTNDLGTINFRLSNIEKTLEDLKQLLITVPITQNELKMLAENTDKNYRILEARISTAETNIDSLHIEVQKLKEAPVKKSADKFEFIISKIFETVVLGVIGFAAFKLGILFK